MAFTFVPNADGSFTEGDRQTNIDTGVEYIYVDGAWRALGPKIEDEFGTLDERYVNKTGDLMTGGLEFGQSTSKDKEFVKFKNDKKANQTSILRINRPYDGDNGSNADGSTNAKGVGGLDIKLMANSDQNRLRIMTGSGANVETLKITAGGNGQQIHAGSAIELSGGSDDRQTIIAKSGIAGHLSYGGNNEAAQRVSWGSATVWISKQLDMMMNKIYNVSDFILKHTGSSASKFIIRGEGTKGADSTEFFYSFKNPDGQLDAMNYTGRQESSANLATVGFVESALAGANFDSYVKKAGDDMVGNLNFTLNGTGPHFKSGDVTVGHLNTIDGNTLVLRAENSKNFKIQARDSSNNSRTFFDAQTNLSSGTGGTDGGYRCKIYHLADPTSDLHAANQRYVKAQDNLRVEGRFKITNSGGNYYIEPN